VQYDATVLDIPDAWETAASLIAARRWRKVLILGAVDRGKSTFCHFLSQRLLAAGGRVAVVDADVGQADIGPPTAITLGYPDVAQPLTAVAPRAWYFVGAVSPVGHLLPMVVGIQQLTEMARAPFVLVNTTGLIQGVGNVLKGYIIEAQRPDVIVALAQGAELQPILRAYRNHRILRLAPSCRAVVKTPEQRREARQQAFARYFQAATEVTIPCHRLVFQRRGLSTSSERNLLSGVADWRNRCLGLAIVQHVSAARDLLTLLTPVPPERLRILQGGSIYLTPDGRELDRLPLHRQAL
jgi:polynucleotide 5'-hydroxyl-kinase GRC3/NOL9